MDNHTITHFPLIEPAGNATYNHIGGDSPSIGAGYEVSYTSNQPIESVLPSIRTYLTGEGYNINEVTIPECNWRNHIRNDSTWLFAGVSKDGGCLDLLLKKSGTGKTGIEAMILY